MEKRNRFVDAILVMMILIFVVMICVVIGVYFYILINPDSTLPKWMEWIKGVDING